MKKTLTVSLVVAMLLSVAASTFNAKDFASLQTDNLIQSIRQQYSAINKRAARYKKVKKELSGFSLEGGQLVAYFDGPAIVKIVANHYGEMGRTVEEYYYSDGKLIFVFEKVFHYNKPMSGKVIRTVENRYYFNNDNLIRWIDEKGKQANTSSDAFRTKQKEILENSNRFIAGARLENPTIER